MQSIFPLPFGSKIARARGISAARSVRMWNSVWLTNGLAEVALQCGLHVFNPEDENLEPQLLSSPRTPASLLDRSRDDRVNAVAQRGNIFLP